MMNNTKNIRERVDVALCFNDAYLKHIGPLVYSLSQNNQDLDFIIHVVYKNLSEQSLQTLRDMVDFFDNVTFDFRYITSDLINQVTVEHTHFPVETYFRLILADVLHDVDRLLYLDIDLLISGSVKGLWELDMEGSCIAAAPEKDIYMYYQWYLDQLGLTDKDTYFSAGVLLFDLKQMRERNLPEVLLKEAIAKGDSLRFCDQDLLNLYFKDEVTYFDERYNYSSWLMANGDKQLDDLSIQHFNGNLKPWMKIMAAAEGQRKFVAQYHQYRRDFLNLTQTDYPTITLLVDGRQAEKHIIDCLESISGQTYQAQDIVVVTEPGDQTTLDQVKTFSQYDRRIRWTTATMDQDTLIHLALAEAHKKSPFISFVKGNDFLEPTYLETLYKLSLDHGADLAIGDFYSLDDQRGIFTIAANDSGDQKTLSKRELLLKSQDRNFNSIVGKLFSKSLLETVASNQDSFALDLNVIRATYLVCQQAAFIQNNLFCQRYNLDLPQPIFTEDQIYQLKLLSLEQALTDSLTLGLEPANLYTQHQDLLAQLADWQPKRLAPLDSRVITQVALYQVERSHP